MAAFEKLDAVAAPLPIPNMDTDQIVPARFLWNPRDSGYGRFLFHDLRVSPDGQPQHGFVLNIPAFGGARILVADDNFGCGSSREAAVWALFDFGIRAVIAPAFGDIFFNNAFKNGLLPIVLPPAKVAELRTWLEQNPGAHLAIDLADQTIQYADARIEGFDVDPFRKRLLLQGQDEIAFTLQQSELIDAFEKDYDSRFGWLGTVPGGAASR